MVMQQTRSRASGPNPGFTALSRHDGEGNLAWGERAVRAMGTGGQQDWSYVVLLGGSDVMSFRLRVAQSHLRSDMLPSLWSEALLVVLADDSVARADAIHVPLLQPDGPGFATRSNGVVRRALADFDDPARFPNVALIALPVSQAKLLERVELFRKSRSTLDALEHVLRWLAYAWGTAGTPNPLHDNFGLPSACMLETVCAGASFDLTPGLQARASCPEAIWVAARYWQDYYQEFSKVAPTGRFFTPHQYAITLPSDEPAPAPQPARKRTARKTPAAK